MPEVAMGRVTIRDLRQLLADNAALDRLEAIDLQDVEERKQRCAGHPGVSKHGYRLLDKQPFAKLFNGYTIPIVGLGTWKSAPGEVRAAVAAALRAGYRHVDCAYVYQNEHEVGEALAEVLAEQVLQRQEIFITSKLWNTDHATTRVRTACLRSMRDLRVDYLDLYLMHWPHGGVNGPTLQPTLLETWRAMEALVDEGLVRSIGMSNFSIVKLQHILASARVRPAVCQVEVHPSFRNDALISFCREQGIHVTAFSPLGSPDSAALMQRQHSPSLLQDPVVLAAAQHVGRDAGQVLIRWAIQHGTSVLPKSVRAERIRSNIEVFDWQLPEADYLALCGLPGQLRAVDGRFLINPRGPYRSLSDLWDDPSEDDRVAAFVRSTYNLQAPCPTATLNTEATIPLLGLGTWKSEKGEVRTAVAAALRAGCRHIDAAEIYRNEHEVGEALSEVLAEGVVPREAIFLTSKLWNTDHGATRVEAAVRKSLRNLQVSYLDLYLIHWPASGNRGPAVQPPLEETWAALERLQMAGLVRAIGVSNFSVVKLQRLMASARIMPAVVQVEVHPYFRNDALIDFCRSHAIHVTAYSPLGSPDSAGIMQRGTACPVLMQDAVVQEVAASVGKSVAQVLIRWGLQHGTSVLAKSVKPERIRANLDVTGWQLDDADYQRLCRLPIQQRMVNGGFLVNPAGPYRSLAELWDEQDA